jgi:tetratricopeptide (TPR) repeat protein
MQSNEQEDIRVKELRLAQDLSSKGEWEGAYDLAYKWLKFDPNDPQALNLIGFIMLNTEKAALAYPILKHLTTVEPSDALAWLNMGMCANDLWRYNESLRAYKKGLACATDDDSKSMLCVNIASLMVDHGRFKEAAPYCRQAIALRPETIKGKANLGFCQLANRDWAEGWRNYRYCLGTEWRTLTNYNDEPLWEGHQKGHICIYGEQGLGDEISFGQMLPDMQKWCNDNDSTLVVDLNPRLKTLFRRSFPDIEIYGTRGLKRVTWDGRNIDYSLPLAQIGEYFRCRDEQFTGEPYLKADPDRVMQWKALFKTKKKPVIGIGWRGGIWKTAAKYRQLDLETLLPVLRSIDAHWVSLQYKPAGKEIEAFKKEHPEIDIVEYTHGTLSNDYDDTVALIAALDMVVTMQTTVVHVAGGIGIPCWTFVPRTSQWRYGQEGEDFPWAKSVRIIRQEKDFEWQGVMERTGEELANFPRISKRATKTPRKQKDKLRNCGGKVRGNRKSNGRCHGDRPSA